MYVYMYIYLSLSIYLLVARDTQYIYITYTIYTYYVYFLYTSFSTSISMRKKSRFTVVCGKSAACGLILRFVAFLGPASFCSCSAASCTSVYVCIWIVRAFGCQST